VTFRKSRSSGGIQRYAWTFALAGLILSIALPGFGQGCARRSGPQRQGNAWVEELTCALPVQPGGKLILRADQGPVSVRAGLQGRLLCNVTLRAFTRDALRARTLFSQFALAARRTGDGAVVINGRFTGPATHTKPASAQYDLQVPNRFNLDVETRGGSLRISALDGELRGSTAGGDIKTGDIKGPVHVETAGGSIQLGNIGSIAEARTAGGNINVGNIHGDANLETSGGEIVAGMVDGTLHARTAGGDIRLEAAAGPVVVETAGGHIYLGPCGATVEAETAGGNIQVEGARGQVKAETAGGSIDLMQLMGAVRAQTAAGRILAQLAANGRSFGPSSLSTSVGDVDVFLPPGLPLTINAVVRQAAGHKITSDFPMRIEGGGAYSGMGTIRGQGEIQGGGQPLNIKTRMGSIRIRKLDAQNLAQLKSMEENFWRQMAAGGPDGSSQRREMHEMDLQMKQQEQQLRKQLQKMMEQLQKQQEEQ
jgi:hypothetical protein